MSGLLGNLVSQVAQNALSGGQSQCQPQGGGMGDMLGGVIGSALGGGQQSGGMGGMLGNVVASQLGGGEAGGLGSVLGSVLGSGQQAGGNQGMLMAMLVPMVLKWIQGSGGLGGALEKAQSLGLDQQVASWMSPEQANINLEASQVTQLFGADEISRVATKVGSEEGLVSQGIAQLLPEVMNQLTPKGGMEDEAQANQEIGDLLGQLGKFL